MNNHVSVRSIFTSSWVNFKRNKSSLLILSVMYCALMCMHAYINYLSSFAEYNFVAAPYVDAVLSFLEVLYGAFFSKNILDVMYHRKLHWFNFSSPVMKASLLNFMMGQQFLLYIYIATVIELPENLYLAGAISLTICAISLCMLYFLVRCMFADLLIIEQNCTIMEAFSKSWQITHGRFLLIMVFAFVMSLLLLVGFLALIVGFVVALPLAILMKAHLFKELMKEEQA